MCTLVLIVGVHPELPVIVAANRDELYARPAHAPRRLDAAPGDPIMLGGVDEQAGGTWMGVTGDGFFAGLTNQRTYALPDPARRSRGELVLAALRAGSIGAVEAALATLTGGAHNPFNLVYGDAAGLRVAYGRDDGLRTAPVPAGVHVLPNDVLDSPVFAPKVNGLRRRVAPVAASTWPTLAAELGAALSDHALPPLDAVPEPPPGAPFDRALLQRLGAVCIHTPLYGTRSATLIALAPGGVARYLFAEGPPCSTAFTDVTGVLSAREDG